MNSPVDAIYSSLGIIKEILKDVIKHIPNIIMISIIVIAGIFIDYVIMKHIGLLESPYPAFLPEFVIGIVLYFFVGIVIAGFSIMLICIFIEETIYKMYKKIVKYIKTKHKKVKIKQKKQ